MLSIRLDLLKNIFGEAAKPPLKYKNYLVERDMIRYIFPLLERRRTRSKEEKIHGCKIQDKSTIISITAKMQQFE